MAGMGITLDNAVVATSHKETVAQQFARIMGLSVGEREGIVRQVHLRPR